VKHERLSLDDKARVAAGMQLLLREAVAAVGQARALPATRAAAEKERDRIAEILTLIRSEEGAQLDLPRDPPSKELG
jgi:hypothetical protein